MNEMMELLRGGGLGMPGFSLEQALLSLLVAFILGQFTAWVYIYTHSGLSYSRAFVQSIVLLTIIVCLAMMVIGNNLIAAFGLIGALAVIRFRNILKDTRDTAFIFFALIAGMASGTGRYLLALLGTILFSLVLVYLHWTSFGSRHIGDGFVRFQITGETSGLAGIQTLMKRYCRSVHLVSQRLSQAGSGEIAFRLTMRDPTRASELVSRLQEMHGVSNVTFVLQEEQAEV